MIHRRTALSRLGAAALAATVPIALRTPGSGAPQALREDDFEHLLRRATPDGTTPPPITFACRKR